MRRGVGLLQLFEAGVALGLAWFGFHVPAAAPGLMVAAAVILGWAVIADGPLGIIHLVPLGMHRSGLLVLGPALTLVPVLAGRLSDPATLLPCVVGAVLLFRMGLVRWPAAVDTRACPSRSRSGPFRTAGRVAGRAAGLAGGTADRAVRIGVPRTARVAGRIVGRRQGVGKD